MTVKQISVFLENRPGTMAELTEVLSRNQVDMRALSLAETSDFGIARIITDDVYNAMQMLKEAGYVCSITKVLAVEIPDRPGELAKVIRYLGDSGINVEYMYAFITRKKDLAYMIFRVEDNEKAIQVLTKKNVKLICQDALDQL
ncbi:MAG TPA: ACT domain-containing protein [Candidatus Blautia gallistercoris]|uniref:ACT domain-containing protein n=1 Tax=Candidatus Blautia gallistercoris TaxID=2838490 RepID=A0A9D2B3A2_9FIRM|nr:ACT domain-containing protein [Candidatus Blautia gallistercoris]